MINLKVAIGLEAYIKTLVVHLPVLVCFAILFLMLSNHTDFQTIDFVNNNPASFKDAYFDFASIRTFTAANPLIAANPFTPRTCKKPKRRHRRSLDPFKIKLQKSRN